MLTRKKIYKEIIAGRYEIIEDFKSERETTVTLDIEGQEVELWNANTIERFAEHKMGRDPVKVWKKEELKLAARAKKRLRARMRQELAGGFGTLDESKGIILSAEEKKIIRNFRKGECLSEC